MEPWGFEMDNVRFGTLATEIARPNFQKYWLPKPGDWFTPSKSKPFVQSEADMRVVVERAAVRFEAARKQMRGE